MDTYSTDPWPHVCLAVSYPKHEGERTGRQHKTAEGRPVRTVTTIKASLWELHKVQQVLNLGVERNELVVGCHNNRDVADKAWA